MKAKYEMTWIIDDNEIDNFINKKILLKSNFSENVKEFNSGDSAEELLNNLLNNPSPENLVPDYVFLDLNMPLCSGIDFMKRCEEILLKLNPEVKVVILTSSINPNDEYTTSLFRVFSGFINKPLSASSLEKLP